MSYHFEQKIDVLNDHVVRQFEEFLLPNIQHSSKAFSPDSSKPTITGGQGNINYTA
jgi:hypothetical protein